MNFKQNLLVSQMEKSVKEVSNEQFSLKTEFSSIFQENKLENVLRRNDDLEKKLYDKTDEISLMNSSFEGKIKFFEKKAKEFLRKLADQEVEIRQLSQIKEVSTYYMLMEDHQYLNEFFLFRGEVNLGIKENEKILNLTREMEDYK